MLVCDIGPIYIKCGLIFEKNDKFKTYLEEELNKEKNDLSYLNLPFSRITYKTKSLFFFRINLAKISHFKNSYDYKLIKQILLDKNNKQNDNSKNNSNIININNVNTTPQCYYCGHIDLKIETILYELFEVKCVKIGHVNQLCIYGLEFISENVENPFFDLPGQSILNLVQVGHKLNEVTQKNYFTMKGSNLYPFLFSNIREGTSVYKVESVNEFTRIGGTTFGATTYWNLVSIACGYDDPEEAVKDAISGNNELIDLSVGDIYGGSYDQFALSSSLIASSFGKLKYVNDKNDVNKADVSRSLITLMCVTISQITAFIALNSNIDRIFIHGNPFSSLEFMQMIQMATNYFSGEKVKAYFSDYAPYIHLIGMCKQLELEDSYFDK